MLFRQAGRDYPPKDGPFDRAGQNLEPELKQGEARALPLRNKVVQCGGFSVHSLGQRILQVSKMPLEGDEMVSYYRITNLALHPSYRVARMSYRIDLSFAA